jgi:starch phosphorylase
MTDYSRQLAVPDIRTLACADFYIPEDYGRLREIAYNLWWSWTPEARMLFSSIHPELWARYRNPVEVLLQVEPHQWESLTVNDAFQASYESVVTAFDRYLMFRDGCWFRSQFPSYRGGPIAYLSTEYGLHESLGIYSGGLGILSGDHCKAASDLGLPFVAVGLLYRRGYFHQTIDAEGRQQHFYPDFDTSRLPLQPVLGPTGRPLVVPVPLLDRQVHVMAFKAQVGRVPLLLLDSDLPQNDPADRAITHILYVRGREMRMCQEMLLGIGAVRVLRALGIDPQVWHLNEGHVAFMALERLREEVKHGERYERACERVKSNVIFTTHTPVEAGNETFDADISRLYLGSWGVQLGVQVNDLMRLGRIKPEDDNAPFNLTVLALRMSSFHNAVSEKHAEVSREMWKDVTSAGQPPIRSVTNGVHTSTWIGMEMRQLLTRAIGLHWEEHLAEPERWTDFDQRISAADLWTAHQAQKRRLIRTMRDALRRTYARHGRSPRELHAVDRLLDPRALTIGFARRFALYKRAGLIFRDLARLKTILGREDRPVQILFAGKAHPADLAGQDLIAQIFRLSESPDFRGKVVFVEDYDMHIARLLYQGVDVWLNNPRRPLEACGTSGQKAALNGALNLSVLDGWWIEGYRAEVGWAIGRVESLADEQQQDTEDASSLYDLLEREVIPLFFDRDADGLPQAWIDRMSASIAELLPRFSAARMVQDYSNLAYLPLATAEVGTTTA